MISQLLKGRYDSVGARTLITRRVGKPPATLVRSILAGGDPETAYYQREQQQLFEGPENHLRLAPTSHVQVAGDVPAPVFDFTKIDEASTHLSTYAEHVFMGVQTGCDIITKRLIDSALEKNLISAKEARQYSIGTGIYVLTQEELERLQLSKSEKHDCIKPFYKNSEIRRYFTPAHNNKFLIYVDSHTDIDRYSKIRFLSRIGAAKE